MRRFVALLTVVLLTACTPEIEQSTRPNSVFGTYQLRAYGGRSVPVVVSTEGGAVTEVLSGELVIGADNTWSETRTYRFTATGSAQTASFVYTGSWTYERDEANMLFNLPSMQTQFTGTAAGGSVTLSMSDGSTVVYSH
jgi:2-polyprenyl-6-methoxyphenol hydroxylase-like FAD-dependent oxidoreductase